MGHRRFPLVSVLVVLVLAGVVVYFSYMDVDVPQRALEKVGQAVSGLGNAVSLIGGNTAGMQGNPVGGTATFPGTVQTATPPQQDAPTPVLVNAKHPVPDGYLPQNLVVMRAYCDPNIVNVTGDDIQGERGAVDALMVMLKAAIEDGLSDWQISEAYRSVQYQQRVWDNKVAEYRQQGLTEENVQIATAKYVARPGYSEHHTGLAFDVTVPDQSFPLTEQSKWLAANCWDYGFIIRYTEDKVAITGINAEPWHIRYVGLPHSKLMQERNQCLEEYLGAV